MYLKVLSSAILALACYMGDILLDLNSSQGSVILRAVTDNLIHGSLAVLVWLLGYLSHWKCSQGNATSLGGTGHTANSLATHSIIILQSVACGLLSCAVDLDHFILSRSFNLEDALHTAHRGLFHNSLLVVFLLVVVYTQRRAGLVLITVSFATHQLRDSIRRGLYLYPFGSTPPLSYPFYLVLMIAIMLIFRQYLPRRIRTVNRTAAPYKIV